METIEMTGRQYVNSKRNYKSTNVKYAVPSSYKEFAPPYNPQRE